MPEAFDIRIVIDPSLVEYFEAGMRRQHIDYSTSEERTRFLAMILNDSMYPIVSSPTGPGEIHLNYRPRAYTDPIF